jgi:hypothetical protein
MSLTGGDPSGITDVMVVFNASPAPVLLDDADVRTGPWELHPVQRASSDPIVREASYDAGGHTFTVPARTTAVFVREGADVPTLAPAADPPVSS